MTRQQYLKRLEAYNRIIDNLLKETLQLKFKLADELQDLHFEDNKELQAEKELLDLKNLQKNFERLSEEKIDFLREYGAKFTVPAGYNFPLLSEENEEREYKEKNKNFI